MKFAKLSSTTSVLLIWFLSAALLGPPCVFADRTLVPIPFFATDPNMRETYGALLAIIEDQDSAVRSLLAPYAMFNPLLGAGGGFRRARVSILTSSRHAQNQHGRCLVPLFI